MAKKPFLIQKKPGESRQAAAARELLRPSVAAAGTIQHYGFSETDINSLVDELEAQSRAIQDDNLQRAEAILAAQAHTLDALFNRMARAAAVNMGHLKLFETFMKLALRAQSQCRASLESLAMIKSPPVVIARQANISAGHQQINNGTPSRARENKILQNELLELVNGERLDFGTAAATGRIDLAMAAVGTLDRTAHAGR